MPTGHKGVRFREHPTRKFGRRADRYFAIRYRKGRGQPQVEEGLGWETEGWTADRAAHALAELQRNIDRGEGPRSLREKREQDDRRKEEAARAAATAARRAAPQTLALADVAELYLAWAASNKDTWRDDAGLLRNHILPHLGAQRMVDITTAHIEALKSALMATPARSGRRASMGLTLAPATVVHCLTLLRRLFNWAADTQMFPDDPDIMLFAGRNPAQISARKQRAVRPPRVRNRRMRIPTDTELDMLFCWLSDPSQSSYHDAANADVADMIDLALDTGLREEEIVSLRAEHVNRQDWSITVTDSKGRDRVVWVGILRTSARTRLAKRLLRHPVGPLFPTPRSSSCAGEPPTRTANAVSRRFGRVCDELGLNDGIADTQMILTFHCLRHWHATRQIERGLDIYELMQLLGHQDIAVTRRYEKQASSVRRRKALQGGSFNGHS